jgi:uncharacterized membrane protein YgdD (TMEM256/DUF423 family)
MNGRIWTSIGALLAGASVALGAVGTHFLKETLHAPEGDLQLFETAVRYQMYHSLALLFVGLLAARGDSRWLKATGVAFLVGIALFSGGLYARVFADLRPAVHVVPFGGLSWLVALLMLAFGAWSSKSSNSGPS